MPGFLLAALILATLKEPERRIRAGECLVIVIVIELIEIIVTFPN